MTRVCSAALDHAARLFEAALGIARVAREPIGPEEPEGEPGSPVALVVALSEGTGQETAFLMGSATPYEFEHPATLEIVAIGGSPEERRARRDEALSECGAAISADPTLGALVDWADFSSVDVATDLRFASASATLNLTYSALSALG